MQWGLRYLFYALVFIQKWVNSHLLYSTIKICKRIPTNMVTFIFHHHHVDQAVLPWRLSRAVGNVDTNFKLVDIPNGQKSRGKQHLAFVIVFFTPPKEEPQKWALNHLFKAWNYIFLKYEFLSLEKMVQSSFLRFFFMGVKNTMTNAKCCLPRLFWPFRMSTNLKYASIFPTAPLRH